MRSWLQVTQEPYYLSTLSMNSKPRRTLELSTVGNPARLLMSELRPVPTRFTEQLSLLAVRPLWTPIMCSTYQVRRKHRSNWSNSEAASADRSRRTKYFTLRTLSRNDTQLAAPKW